MRLLRHFPWRLVHRDEEVTRLLEVTHLVESVKGLERLRTDLTMICGALLLRGGGGRVRLTGDELARVRDGKLHWESEGGIVAVDYACKVNGSQVDRKEA